MRLYLYTKDTRHITYSEFINRELILFSNADNVRSIPSLMDGLKPGQRKVIFTCIKRNLTQKELKVAQLAGSVAEQSAYHHGEGSLMSTIINLAQNFVGSNNLNMLQPIGQFGTRLHGGKDAASPRYIFTMLSPLACMVVNSKDDALLRHLSDDNQRIEPEWYCPILPMVLVNGADGIGTGWSTKVPNYDIRGIVNNLRRLLQGQEPLPMVPSFKNFRGTIEELGENRFICSGEILVIDDSTVEITELPVRTWSQTYKEEVLEPLLMGTDKTPALITDYKDYNTDTTVKFVVKMTPEKLAQAEQTGLHKVFKLQSNLSTNMVLFDNNGCIKKYSRVEEILREFFAVRVDFYHRRKVYLEGMLTAESLKLDNIARFILEKIEGTIVIENKPKREIIQTLVRRGYDSDPVKDWKEAQKKDKEDYIEEEEEGSSVSSATAAEDKGAPDFNYILNLPMWCLTKERKDELLKQGESKREELQELRKKSPSDMWNDDLDELIIALDEVEQKEREDMKMAGKPAKQGKVGKLKSKKAIEQIQPSPVGRRIQPRIDSATKMRAEKADARKTKGPKSRKGKLLLEEGVSENTNDEAVTVKEEDTAAAEPEPEPLSLAQRLKLASDMKAKMTTSEAAPAAAAAKEKKPRKPAGTTQGRPAKGGSGGSPAKGKKGKKRGAWSDFEDDEDMIDASSEDDDIAGPTVAQSRGPRRAAANKAKFAYDDSDDDFVVEDDSDEEFSPESFKPSVNKAKAAPAATDENDDEDSPIRAAPKRKFAGLSDDDDDDKEECIPAQTAKGATKKAVVSCSDSDDSFTFEAEEKPAPAKAKAKPAAKKATAKAAAKPAGDAVVSAACDGAFKDKDESSDMPEPVSKPAAKKASTKPPAAKKAKKDPKQPSVADAFKVKATAAPAKSKTIKPMVFDWTDESEPDNEESGFVANPPAKKGDGDSKPKKGKGKQGHSSDSDAEDMCAPKKKRTLAKKAAKKDSDCSDMDDMDAVPAPRRAPTGRAKAPVKYNFDDSMEDFDDDF
ncbi:hypothetical protein ACOMHN_030053 [Nucella lapillus]